MQSLEYKGLRIEILISNDFDELFSLTWIEKKKGADVLVRALCD
jgi:hypothetical protein